MATLAQLRFNILNLKAGGKTSDDDWLAPAQIDFIIAYSRSILIRRDYQKRRFLDPNIEQDLGCVEMELVDNAECCNVQTGCLVLRSVLPIPNFVELQNSNLVSYVGTVDKTHAFDLIPSARARWINNNKYTAGLRRAFFIGAHLYIVNDKLLKYINVRGVFEDPAQAAKFNHCSGEPCFDPNTSEYPISFWMIGAITDMVLKGEVRETLVVPKDTENNASGDATTR